MKIILDNEMYPEFDKGFFEEIVKVMKEFVAIPNTELSLALMENEDIRSLNKDYRGVDAATDVLSFPMGDNGILGDIAISVEYAKRNTDSLPKEVAYLFIHGVLHLLGYKHEEDAETAPMFELQDEIHEAAVHKLKI